MSQGTTIGGLLETARARLVRLLPVQAQEATSSGALVIDILCADL